MRMTIILILTLLFAGCGGPSGSSVAGKKHVVAAFYPLAFAAQQLGGSRVRVENVTPPGAEPHDLEVSPAIVQDVQSADLVLLLLDTPGLRRFSNNDPHVWLDPHRFELIVERIGRALHTGARTIRLVRRLRALDREYRAGLAHCKRHEIATSHEAFAYLAQRYGLRQVAITGLSPEAEPAPRDLQRVVDLVRKTHATTIFYETLVSPRIAETVARETGARTAVLNPIEGLKPFEAKRGEDYFSLMRSNLAQLRTALGCR